MEKITITSQNDVDIALNEACEKLNITMDEVGYKVISYTDITVTIEAWKKIKQPLYRLCPECDSKILSKAVICPFCGCAIEKTIKCACCEFDTNKTYKQIQEMGYSILCANCGNSVIVSTAEQELAWKQQRINEKKIEVTCPYCHSGDTKKISGLSKAGSVALVGIFALDKIGKQWHCNNCKSDF